MTDNLMGLPLPLWGLICLALAVVWVFVWPKDRADPDRKVRFFIIRWFHTIVWLLLALAAFTAGFDILGGRIAGPIAWLSLVTYITLLITLFTGKKTGKA